MISAQVGRTGLELHLVGEAEIGTQLKCGRHNTVEEEKATEAKSLEICMEFSESSVGNHLFVIKVKLLHTQQIPGKEGVLRGHSRAISRAHTGLGIVHIPCGQSEQTLLNTWATSRLA